MGKNQIIAVFFNNIEIGRVGYDEDQRKASFQYNPEFLKLESYKNLFPYIIKRTPNVQVFSEFQGETFRGLPPMIADSLPDSFGNVIFKEWLESTHNNAEITPLEQLSYVGERAMGGLEFRPAKNLGEIPTIDIKEVSQILKKVLDLKLSVEERKLSSLSLLNIFKIGSSAGGARPKIIVSEHKETGKIIPGDISTSQDYHHWLVKLSLDEEQKYSREKIEYIYYKMATANGIEMMHSKLIDERHFATTRFDRQNGEKKHILTASGITGWDFKDARNSSYENLFKLCIALKLLHGELEQLFRRMVFNVVFANYDDHLKNFSFIYDKDLDRWNLAPAYDLTYPFDPLLNFIKVTRALSINGKRKNILEEDILKIADDYSIRGAKNIIKTMVVATDNFKVLAEEYDIPAQATKVIDNSFVRLK